jgi:capsular exopolysaccharide synthesis family protein
VTIAQYVRLLRQHWLLVALITLAGTTGAAAYSWLQTPVYQADTQLFVSTSSDGGDITQLTQGSTFTQQRVKSYTDLVTSPRVLTPVIRQLQLSETSDQLAVRVKATSPLDTVLIDVTVTDVSPVRARDIADAVAAQVPALVAQLETPDGRSTSPVKVSITRRATVAATPISPRKSLNLALGLLVGLGLGVGAAVLRDGLDRTVSSRAQAAQIANAPVLGTVADDPKASEARLITADGFSLRAEAYRHLRTNIRFLSVDHQLRSLVVTGSVAGEGKTTTAANLAIALAQSGERVVLIDADLRRPTVADVFGLPAGIGLTTVLLGEVAPDAALQNWRNDLPLQVLASGPVPPNPSELIGSARMADLIRHLTDAGTTVVIDSPPLLPVTDAAVLARATDGALVVTRAGATHTDQLAGAVAILRTAGATVLGLVLNRVTGRSSSGYGSGYYDGYSTYGPDLSRYTGEHTPGPLRPAPLPAVAPMSTAAPMPAAMAMPTATPPPVGGPVAVGTWYPSSRPGGTAANDQTGSLFRDLFAIGRPDDRQDGFGGLAANGRHERGPAPAVPPVRGAAGPPASINLPNVDAVRAAGVWVNGMPETGLPTHDDHTLGRPNGQGFHLPSPPQVPGPGPDGQGHGRRRLS